MKLSDQIQNDMTEAMKARDASRVDALRMLRAAMLELQKSGDEVTDELEMRTMQKQAKMRRESIEQFEAAGRADLVEKETNALKVIEEYLPTMMTEDEIRVVVQRVVAETGAAGMNDFKIVMPKVMAEVKGKADGSLVQSVVKGALSGEESTG